MTYIRRFVGIDPGLVHSGLVLLQVSPAKKELSVSHAVIDGANLDPEEIAKKITSAVASVRFPVDYIYIEKFRERGQVYASVPYMRVLELELMKRMPNAHLVDNTGSRRVVKKKLLKLFGMDSFPATNHQDLQAAARILIYGMLKNDALNEEVLSGVLKAHLEGNPYTIHYS